MRVTIFKREKSVPIQETNKLTRVFELSAPTFEVVRYLLNSLSWPIWSIFIPHRSNLTAECRSYEVVEKKTHKQLDLEQTWVTKNMIIWGFLPFPCH